MAPGYNPNQFWLIICIALWHLLKANYHEVLNLTIHEMGLKIQMWNQFHIPQLPMS